MNVMMSGYNLMPLTLHYDKVQCFNQSSMKLPTLTIETICILYGFLCEMDFSHPHESPNPTRVACDEGGILR